MLQRSWLICSLINLRWMKKKQKNEEGRRQWLLQRLLSAVHLNLWKSLPLPHLLDWTRYYPWNWIEPTLHWPKNITHIEFKKAFQRCEEIFLLNDFMPPVMTWKQFSSSLQPTCDWYRNNVRNAEAFMKSRLLFLEMIAQKSLKKL